MAYSKKLLLALAMSSAALLSVPAQAMVITYGGQVASDGSGLTSTHIPASNTGLGSGWFVETFDLATAYPSSTPLKSPGNADISVAGAGCSVNAFGQVAITTTGGGFAVQKGSTSGIAAAPANDGTCFGFGPRPDSALASATVKVDYSGFLPAGVKISYLGLYYGSIDTYNDINLYDDDALIGTIEGSAVLAAFPGTDSGDQMAPGSNVYVNFDFAPNEVFTAFEFVTRSRAFEMDNIVVGLTSRSQVPEPGSLALLGAGLLGFAATRRRQRQG